MKILIIGSGGREHALAWKAAQSSQVEIVFVAPGNAGTHSEIKVKNIQIDSEDIPALINFALANSVDLTIVGPEAPLVAGITNQFNAAGLKCFGPNRDAAQLEGSKYFSKDFLARNQIPTAAYEHFTQLNQAIAYIKSQATPLVIKADGLAAGKGVIIAHDQAAAIAAATDMLEQNQFGDAGARIIIEEFLAGEEASFICIVDGETILPMASSQDHKARNNGDQGPNTGGMGAYSPAPVVTGKIHKRIMSEVMLPTLKGLLAQGIHYTGFLYAGIMVAKDGTPNVVEFNCRFGDPEAQPIMMRLNSDLVTLCLAAINGELEKQTIEWDPRAALGVVMAAGGYPAGYKKGQVISGLDLITMPDVKVFHAGTSLVGNNIVTNGGRVLCITALGETIKQAQKLAYKAVEKISWEQVYYRTDIGHRAIDRKD